MKNHLKSIITLNIFWLLSGGIACAQQQYLGTKTPYVFPAQENTPPPIGFHPLFIEYVGRHASRFFTKPEADKDLVKIMSKGNLTRLGKKVLVAVREIYAIQQDNYGSITQSGETELEEIGKRMRQQYVSVWQGRGIDIVWTNKKRTHQSEAAFMKGFGNYNSTKMHIFSPADSLNNTLRFYDISPAYEKYKKGYFIKSEIDSLRYTPRSKAVSRNIYTKIFKKFSPSDAWRFTQNMYEIYCLLPVIKKEITARDKNDKRFIAIYKAFTKGDLQWLDFITQAKDFYEKGPGENNNGIQIKIAAPLLADFLNTIKEEIQQPDSLDAKLNFTHAETISPFACLLGIPEASQASASVFNYAKNWQANKIISMASNIQWVLYSNGKSYLVKVLLNEKAARLPISTTIFPYYHWEDMKGFYLKKLAALDNEKEPNWHNYLLNLKH